MNLVGVMFVLVRDVTTIFVFCVVVRYIKLFLRIAIFPYGSLKRSYDIVDLIHNHIKRWARAMILD